MNGYMTELESLLELDEFDEFEERAPRRAPIRSPSRQSSFTPRPATQAASQTQVQSAARNLDSKIETLTAAVKTLETRVNGVSADQTRLTTAIKKEVDDRKKSNDVIRGDLQQTKLLGALLPMISQETVEISDGEGKTQKVLVPPSSPIASFLPLFLVMGGGMGGDGSKGGMDGILPLLLIVSLGKK